LNGLWKNEGKSSTSDLLYRQSEAKKQKIIQEITFNSQILHQKTEFINENLRILRKKSKVFHYELFRFELKKEEEMRSKQ